MHLDSNSQLRVPIVLTLGNTDCSGGAGVFADVRALATVGCLAAPVVAGVGAQSPDGLRRIEAIDTEMIVDQIDAVVDAYEVGAIKVGTLALNPRVYDHLLAVTGHRVHIVVDPVLVSAAGSILCSLSVALEALEMLLPRTTVLTPNVEEALLLTGEFLVLDALDALASRGPGAVLITGIEEPGLSVDLLDTGAAQYRFATDLMAGRPVHGAGCTHSATLAGLLCLGADVVSAAEQSKVTTTAAVRSSVRSRTGTRVCFGLPGGDQVGYAAR
jgi:hydroxymethylpyrimidine/phosphomethylpyrimidine kinase